jgi:RHS repeat-associated protein
MKKLLLVLFLSLIVVTAVGLSFQIDSYDVHYGDVNGDGVSDVYLDAKQKILLLGGEVITPVSYTDGPNYLMLGNNDGSFQPYEEWTQEVDLSLLHTGKFKIYLADMDGNGREDLLLQSSHASTNSIILYAAHDRDLAGSYNFDKVDGEYASSDYSTWTLKDINGDGKTDLLLNNGQVSQKVGISRGISGLYKDEYGVPNYTDVAKKIVVGATPGEVDVDGSSGTASYRIPLSVPTGAAGVSPLLALEYQSYKGIGDLGLGFTLTGFSKITKCPTSLAIEGYISSPDEYDQSAFCLDGQRLVPTNRSLREFRLRIDPIAKIVSFGGTAVHPEGWHVLYKSGEKEIYGDRDSFGSFPNDSNEKLEWYVTRKEDVLGNGYDIYYNDPSDDSETIGTPNFISYRNVNDSNDDPRVKIDFLYKELESNDRRKIFLNGYSYYRRTVLEKVISTVDGKQYRSYSLTYANAPRTNNLHLKSVQECGADNTCFAATTFTWNQASENSTHNSQPYISGICPSGERNGAYGDCRKKEHYNSFHYPDVNGDGYTDVCYRSSRGVVCHFNTSSGVFVSGDYISTDICGDGDRGEECNDSDNHPTIKFLDFNRDGKDDLLFRGDSGLRIYTSQGKNFSLYKTFNDVCPGGDDCLTREDKKATHLYTPELNGDGRPELCWINDASYFKCKFSDINSPDDDAYGAPVELTRYHWSLYDRDNIYFADLNGNGIQEVIVRKKERRYKEDAPGLLQISYMYFTGDKLGLHHFDYADICSYYAVSERAACDDVKDYEFVFGNVNGDAYDDICYQSVRGIECLLSRGFGVFRGDAFEHYRYTSFLVDRNGSVNLCGDRNVSPKNDYECYLKKNNSLNLIDFNGDGMDDLLYRGASGIRVILSNGLYINKDSGIHLPFCKGDGTDSHCNNNDEQFNSVSAVDLNSDGFPDIVYRDSQGLKIHYSNYGEKRHNVDVLRMITNAHGLKYEFQYSNFHDKDIYEFDNVGLDFKKQIISKRTLRPLVSKLRTTTVNDIWSETNYKYFEYRTSALIDGGSSFKKFYSYKNNGVDNGLKTEVRYNVNFPLMGRPDRVLEFINLQGDYVLDSVSHTDWGVRHDDWFRDKEKINYVTNNRTLDYQYEKGSLIKLVSTENYFDGETTHASDRYKYGDVTRQVVRTYGADAAWSGNIVNAASVELEEDSGWDGEYDEEHTKYGGRKHQKIETVSTYKPVDESNRNLGRIENATVTKTDFDGKSNTKSSSWTYYDNGLLKTETFSPGTDFERKTEYKYNEVGQKTEVEITAASGVSSKICYEYKGGFLYKTTNALNQSSFVLRHNILGLPESTVDVNGFITSFEYDGFGREKRVASPSGVIKETVLSEHPKDFPGTKYTATTTNNIGGFSRIYFDKAGYRLGVATKGDDGAIRYQRYEHNDQGMITKTFLPALSATALTTHSGIDELDYKLRVTQRHNSRGDTSSVDYHAYHKVVTNEKGQSKTQYIRPDGKTSKVIQADDHVISYTYNVDGALTTTTSEGVTITNTYDDAGRRVSIDDPDKGTWKYTYNALDQLVMQENAKGIKTCFVFDKLGRQIERYDSYTGTELQAKNQCASGRASKRTLWKFDTADLGNLGSKVKGALHQIINSDGYTETYYYDNFGRSVKVERKINNKTYVESKSYDQFSRLFSHTYPSGLRIQNHYSNHGTLEKVINSRDGYTYWKAEDYDSLGRLSKIKLGNGLYEHTIYADTHSVVDEQVVSSSETLPASYITERDRLWLKYEYDEIDNYTKRQNLSSGISEIFEFDNLNRMEVSHLWHGDKKILTETMQYERNGNIGFKPGVGTYSYNQACAIGGISGAAIAGPHAVSTVEYDGKATSYCYDANGNMIADSKRRLYYADNFDKPLRITHENGAEIKFSYDHNRARYYRRDQENEVITETFYAGSGYERVVKNLGQLNETILEKHYIAGNAVEIHTNGVKDKPERHYLHKDNLGSVVMVTGVNGAAIERYNFDAWGQKRNLKGLRIPGYLELDVMTVGEREGAQAFEADINGDGYKDLYVQPSPTWVLIASSSPSFLIPTYDDAWLYLGTAEGAYEKPVSWFGNLSTSGMKQISDLPVKNATTEMGFTGHEQLDSVGLIHMGGRVYDSALGRMLNADPFVQAPANSQSFNRYSYVINNPVSLVDPTGYLWNPLKTLSNAYKKGSSFFASYDDAIRPAVDRVADAYRRWGSSNPRTLAMVNVAACSTPNPAYCSLIVGINSGVMRRDFKAGVRAAAVAYLYSEASEWIGGYGGNEPTSLEKLQRVGMHGVLGGAYSSYYKSSFWRGALSTMAAEAAAEFAPKGWIEFRGNSRIVHAAEAAFIGGTSQVIMGGGTQGFVNGAASAAMSRLFNYLSSFAKRSDGNIQAAESAALRAAGLNESTATYSCSALSIALCTGVATVVATEDILAFSPHDGTLVVDVYIGALSAANFANESVQYGEAVLDIDLSNTLVKEALSRATGPHANVLDKVFNWSRNYGAAAAYCKATCGKQRWERDAIIYNQRRKSGN